MSSKKISISLKQLAKLIKESDSTSKTSEKHPFTEHRGVQINGSRAFTNALIEDAEEGLISWESIARAALGYMSEDQVQDLAETEFEYEEVGDEDDEEIEEVSESYRKYTQRDLRQMVRNGDAIDITNYSFDQAKEFRSRGYDVVGVCTGVYGLNGALLQDKEGQLYAVICRNTILSYLV